MARMIVKNAIVVNEGQQFIGSVLVDGERICKVIDHTDVAYDAVLEQNCETVIDATGLYLLPGVIDDHVHFREPGYTAKSDIASESRAAAAGGVTSYMEMPNTMPPTTTLELLEEKFNIASSKSLVNYSFYFGASADNIHVLPLLKDSKACGVKIFMGSSTGAMAISDDEIMRKIFKSSPLIIMAHCEDDGIIADNIKAFKKRYKGQNDFPVRYHSRIRTVEACYAASSKAVMMAQETGARLHLAHISSEKELSLLSSAPLSEKRITAEVCIPHLIFTTEDYDSLGTKIKCNPSVKADDDRHALIQGLSDGYVDVVATDHAPHQLSDKVGGALNAASGMPLVQFSLVAMLQLVEEGKLELTRVPKLMSHNPAELFGVKERGFIRDGYYADFVLVESGCPWVVEEDTYLTKCRWSPMLGRKFSWKVRRTVVNGHTVFSDGKLSEINYGKPLCFDR